MKSHAYFMRLALRESLKAKTNTRPNPRVGAILVRKNKVLATGFHHQAGQIHAEIDCLRNAGRVGSYKGAVLYSTLMPCYLCAGAVVQFGIKKVYAGESKTFSGAREFMESHGVEVIDLESEECINMMNKFIAENPKLWNEDIGEL